MDKNYWDAQFQNITDKLDDTQDCYIRLEDKVDKHSQKYSDQIQSILVGAQAQNSNVKHMEEDLKEHLKDAKKIFNIVHDNKRSVANLWKVIVTGKSAIVGALSYIGFK